MVFSSGFSLKKEQIFFEEYIDASMYCVCGFSYGAIKAFEYVKEQLTCSKRVDRLQLFSPAFFQTKDAKFKRLQLMGYRKDQDKYLKDFTDLCFYPHAKKDTEHCETNVSELEELLNHEWDIEELKTLAKKDVKIEVYLGGKDKIIDVERAREFFLEVATVTYIKDANHFLQIT
ncbi:MAG: pimelyl-ACP methyl ester esterase BioV [Sulfurimonas sp.]|nr:pimelyl-ACP methyl ester esterase BioV [Sulfurimonas sp.]